MNNNNNSGAVSVERARELILYSRNSEDASSHFDLDFGASGQGLSLIGEALKENTHVESIQINLQFLSPTATNSCDGLCYFLQHNPSLKTVWIKSFHLTSTASTIQSLLQACSQNKAIRKLSLSGGLHRSIFSTANNTLGFLQHVQEFALRSDAQTALALAKVWPSSHSVTHLRLEGMAQQGGWMPELFSKLAVLKGKPATLDKLRVSEWDSCVTTFLLSYKTSVTKLVLDGVRFDGFKKMDRVLWALMGSRTTTDITFEDCSFDDSAIEIFLERLEAGELAVTKLGFNLVQLGGPLIQRFIACEYLKSFSYYDERAPMPTNNLALWCQGIENCSLESIMFPAVELPYPLSRSLSVALTRSLRKVEFCFTTLHIQFSKWLRDMIQKEHYSLQHLSMEDFGLEDDDEIVVIDDDDDDDDIDEDGDNDSTNNDNNNNSSSNNGLHSRVMIELFRSMEGENSLETLRLVPAVDDFPLARLIDPLVESLPKMKSLRELKIVYCHEKFNSETEQKIANAMAQNWSLETFLLLDGGGGSDFDDKDARTGITTSLRKKLDACLQRNKLKKQIDFIATDDITNQEKIHWVSTMASFWTLPDDLSLAFWLIERMQSLF